MQGRAEKARRKDLQTRWEYLKKPQPRFFVIELARKAVTMKRNATDSASECFCQRALDLLSSRLFPRSQYFNSVEHGHFFNLDRYLSYKQSTRLKF